MLQFDEDIAKVSEFVRLKLKDAEKGHDWWHCFRVWKNATIILSSENCNKRVVEAASFLHDIADSKFFQRNEQQEFIVIRSFLEELLFSKDEIEQVLYIIEHISFRKEKSFQAVKTIEFKIVQDADRLDAIGAIGIARAFHYGGYKNRPIYVVDDFDHENALGRSIENSSGIAHFYEKLILLKDKMNTSEGRRMAIKKT
jgi:uncharacterized protein